ncbi:phage terminase small subunit [Stenotrophomonas sp. MMGLT7]|uniref:phage terminase small subunit n=1 Tax=Stenotrophomonas sp. MMGLT7 TaxID=2901227 RepID=UPI001E630220|nr:phage terminase small subunit [Stenotrophomonas sp. MMGLT7]MCD7096995.1 terminase [Stenotrophomonas sp. MMGLT7]
MSIARSSFHAKRQAKQQALEDAQAKAADKAAAAAEAVRVQPAIAQQPMPAPVKTAAQRNRVRRQAAKEGVTGTALRGDLTQYEQHLAKLHQDRLRLKQVQSTAAKAELKKTLVGEYDAYLDGVLLADAGAPDDVLTTLLVWNIDAANYPRALELAAYAFQHKLEAGDQFKRTLGTIVAEEFAEAALDALAAGQEPMTPDLEVLAKAAALTANQDMPDEVRAKLLLAQGRAVLRPASDDAPPPADVLRGAVDNLKQAIALHSSCGGKKDLERAERFLKKLAG